MDTQISTQTIYAIHTKEGMRFCCGAHLHIALPEIKQDRIYLSHGEAADTFDCEWE